MIKEYYADGSKNQSYFTQLNPHAFPNNTSHYSGCGATAWMNLYGWHNLNFTPTLLDGEPRENNDNTNTLTMQLHNYLGTLGIPFSNDGLTWPWCMAKGSNFAKEMLSHSANGYKYRIRNFAGAVFGYRDGHWVFEMVKEYIINKKKPVIIGYFDDWHFAIGYGIIETHMETERGSTYLIKINRGWGSEGYSENDTTISPKDIFSCYGIDDFLSL
ncbi:MAG: hypothetical protein K0R09_3798 [Clostridiales bacterium]|nr:hypothetical protein [Clostridiales bacterium]